MENYNKEQKVYLDKIDELLSIRDSKKNSLQDTNGMIMQGFLLIKSMPIRWYVRNNGQEDFKKVSDYLKEKYNRGIGEFPQDCGIGELHGQFAFVPHDVDYSWEITQEEFNYLQENIRIL